MCEVWWRASNGDTSDRLVLFTVSSILIQGIAMVSPVVIPIGCSWPRLNE
jgi:hypothetical protein